MKKSFSNLALLCLLTLTISCNNSNPDGVSKFKYNSTLNSTLHGRAGYCIGDHVIIHNLNDVDEARFIVLSKDNPENILDNYFSEKEHLSSIRGTDSWVDDGLIYSSYRRDLAWKMTGKECIPYISITVPKEQKLPDQLIDEMIDNGTISPQGDVRGDYTYGLSEIKECDGFITGQLNDGKSFIYFIFDKGSGKSRFFKYPAKEVWQQLPIGENVCAGYKDCFCAIVNPESIIFLKTILGNIGKEPTQEKFRQAYNAISALTENGYAIVARIWLKGL